MEEIVPAEVLAALDRGVLLLVPNERAARTLQRAWNHIQHSRQQTTWAPANVLSWRGWLHLLWRRLLLDGRTTAVLLTRLQEQRVWRDRIESSDAPVSLRSVDSLAALASQAWQRLCAYRGLQRLRNALPHLQGDTLQFAIWARSFEETCKQQSMLSEALLEEELIKHLAVKDIEVPGIVAAQGVLLGFDRQTPAQRALLEALRSRGHAIIQSQTSPPRAGLLVAAADETEELRSCARWISNLLKKSPGLRVALIVKDLDRERESIDSVLRELLSPELENIVADADLVPYEFSLGRPLSYQPMVQTALNLLHWALGPLPLEQVNRLLLSSYFVPADQEKTARAEFDAFHLCQQLRLRPEVTIGSFLQQLQHSSAPHARLRSLLQALEGMEQAQSQFDLRPRSYAEWSEWMRAWLTRAHWGSSASSLFSYEFQLRERWENALDSLATLDLLGTSVDLHEALGSLEALSKALIFAPEARDAPVQILGPIEAAGQTFDALWVLRAGEMQWPPATVALSLLPWSVQCDLQMPGTDPERDRAAALELTHRLAASATEVVFSYAQSTIAEGPQRAAAVVRGLEFENVTITNLLGPEQPVAPPVPLDRVFDNADISPLPDQVYPGGARILELQAACGFRAFAELRLGASKLRNRDFGLSTMERGNVVHSALEEFWKRVGSQRELRNMDQTQRDAIVQHAVTKGLARAQTTQADPWDSAYLDLQRVRLTELLRDWIQIELRRPEFTVMAQEEAAQNISLGPLRLSLRVDRIDQVDGQQVILDYKTGLANTTDWLGDRPDQPQVPLYAILASEAAAQSDSASLPLAAVGFGEVRAGKGMRLRGFETAPGVLNAQGAGKPLRMDAESFHAQVARWHEVLERLAIEFAEGDIRVRPKQYPSTCARCGQRLLCRLDAASIVEEAVDANSEESPEGSEDQPHG